MNVNNNMNSNYTPTHAQMNMNNEFRNNRADSIEAKMNAYNNNTTFSDRNTQMSNNRVNMNMNLNLNMNNDNDEYNYDPRHKVKD
jgi:hypothetical protein